VTGLASPEPDRTSAFFLVTPAAPLAASTTFWSGNGLLLGSLLVLTAAVIYFGYLAAHPEIRIRRRARAIVRAALHQTRSQDDDGRASARRIVHALQVGSAALLGAEDEAMTQSDVERALPGASRPLLDDLFVRATSDRFAVSAESGVLSDETAARALLRQLLPLL